MSENNNLLTSALRGGLLSIGLLCMVFGKWSTPTPYLGIGIVLTQLFNSQVGDVIAVLRDWRQAKRERKAAKKADKVARREARRQGND